MIKTLAGLAMAFVMAVAVGLPLAQAQEDAVAPPEAVATAETAVSAQVEEAAQAEKAGAESTPAPATEQAPEAAPAEEAATAAEPAPEAATAESPVQPGKIENSTPEAAQALAERAAQYVRENGAAAAIAEFNKRQGDFVRGDLYVWAVNKDGQFTAQPVIPALVGTNQIEMKDVDNTPFVRRFTEVKRGEASWISYKWPHPVSKKVLLGKSYVINVNGVILGVTAYQDK